MCSFTNIIFTIILYYGTYSTLNTNFFETSFSNRFSSYILRISQCTNYSPFTNKIFAESKVITNNHYLDFMSPSPQQLLTELKTANNPLLIDIVYNLLKPSLLKPKKFETNPILFFSKSPSILLNQIYNNYSHKPNIQITKPFSIRSSSIKKNNLLLINFLISKTNQSNKNVKLNALPFDDLNSDVGDNEVDDENGEEGDGLTSNDSNLSASEEEEEEGEEIEEENINKDKNKNSFISSQTNNEISSINSNKKHDFPLNSEVYEHFKINNTDSKHWINESQFILQLDGTKSQTDYHKSLQTNPYLNKVIRLSPNELILQFLKSAPQRVQEAVKTTVIGLLGTLPKFSLETTILTTTEKLANLLFQLIITGYMLKNAEYRLSLNESLMHPQEDIENNQFLFNNTNYPNDKNSSQKEIILPNSSTSSTKISSNSTDKNNPSLYNQVTPELNNSMAYNNTLPKTDPFNSSVSQVKGTISFHTNDGKIIQTSASSLVSDLRTHIISLQDQIQALRQNKLERKANDLLGYIKSLPEAQIRSLTENISEEVIDAMRKLTNIILDGLGTNKETGTDSITQQTGSVLAQLCMWQLAVGYSFRDLEVREDIRKSLENS